METVIIWQLLCVGVRISETSHVKYMYLCFLRVVPACQALAVSALRGPFPFQALLFSFSCVYVCLHVCGYMHVGAHAGGGERLMFGISLDHSSASNEARSVGQSHSLPM